MPYSFKPDTQASDNAKAPAQPPDFKSFADNYVKTAVKDSAVSWDSVDDHFAQLPMDASGKTQDASGLKRNVVDSYVNDVLPQYYPREVLPQMQAKARQDLTPAVDASKYTTKPPMGGDDAVNDKMLSLAELRDETSSAVRRAKINVALDAAQRKSGRSYIKQLGLNSYDTDTANDLLWREKQKRTDQALAVKEAVDAGSISVEEGQKRLDSLAQETLGLEGAERELNDHNFALTGAVNLVAGAGKAWLGVADFATKLATGTASGLAGKGFAQGWGDENVVSKYLAESQDSIDSFTRDFNSSDDWKTSEEAISAAFKDGGFIAGAQAMVENPKGVSRWLGTQGPDFAGQMAVGVATGSGIGQGVSWLSKATGAVKTAEDLATVMKAAQITGMTGATTAYGANANAREVRQFVAEQFSAMDDDSFLSLPEVQAESSVWMRMPKDERSQYIAQKKRFMLNNAEAEAAGLSTAVIAPLSLVGVRYGLEGALLESSVGKGVTAASLGSYSKNFARSAALSGGSESASTFGEMKSQQYVTVDTLHKDWDFATPFRDTAEAMTQSFLLSGLLEGSGGIVTRYRDNKAKAAAAAAAPQQPDDTQTEPVQEGDGPYTPLHGRYFDNIFTPPHNVDNGDGSSHTTPPMQEVSDYELENDQMAARVDRAYAVFADAATPFSMAFIESDPTLNSMVSDEHRAIIKRLQEIAGDRTQPTARRDYTGKNPDLQGQKIADAKQARARLLLMQFQARLKAEVEARSSAAKVDEALRGERGREPVAALPYKSEGVTVGGATVTKNERLLPEAAVTLTDGHFKTFMTGPLGSVYSWEATQQDSSIMARLSEDDITTINRLHKLAGDPTQAATTQAQSKARAELLSRLSSAHYPEEGDDLRRPTQNLPVVSGQLNSQGNASRRMPAMFDPRYVVEDPLASRPTSPIEEGEKKRRSYPPMQPLALHGDTVDATFEYERPTPHGVNFDLVDNGDGSYSFEPFAAAMFTAADHLYNSSRQSETHAVDLIASERAKKAASNRKALITAVRNITREATAPQTPREVNVQYADVMSARNPLSFAAIMNEPEVRSQLGDNTILLLQKLDDVAGEPNKPTTGKVQLEARREMLKALHRVSDLLDTIAESGKAAEQARRRGFDNPLVVEELQQETTSLAEEAKLLDEEDAKRAEQLDAVVSNPIPLEPSKTALALEAGIPVSASHTVIASAGGKDAKAGVDITVDGDGEFHVMLSGDPDGTARIHQVSIDDAVDQAAKTAKDMAPFEVASVALTGLSNRIAQVVRIAGIKNTDRLFPAVRYAVYRRALETMRSDFTTHFADGKELTARKARDAATHIAMMRRSMAHDAATILDGPRGRSAKDYVMGKTQKLVKRLESKQALLDDLRNEWFKHTEILDALGTEMIADVMTSKHGIDEKLAEAISRRDTDEATVMGQVRDRIALNEMLDAAEAVLSSELPAPESADDVSSTPSVQALEETLREYNDEQAYNAVKSEVSSTPAIFKSILPDVKNNTDKLVSPSISALDDAEFDKLVERYDALKREFETGYADELRRADAWDAEVMQRDGSLADRFTGLPEDFAATYADIRQTARSFALGDVAVNREKLNRASAAEARALKLPDLDNISSVPDEAIDLLERDVAKVEAELARRFPAQMETISRWELAQLADDRKAHVTATPDEVASAITAVHQYLDAIRHAKKVIARERAARVVASVVDSAVDESAQGNTGVEPDVPLVKLPAINMRDDHMHDLIRTSSDKTLYDTLADQANLINKSAGEFASLLEDARSLMNTWKRSMRFAAYTTAEYNKRVDEARERGLDPIRDPEAFTKYESEVNAETLYTTAKALHDGIDSVLDAELERRRAVGAEHTKRAREAAHTPDSLTPASGKKVLPDGLNVTSVDRNVSKAAFDVLVANFLQSHANGWVDAEALRAVIESAGSDNAEDSVWDDAFSVDGLDENTVYAVDADGSPVVTGASVKARAKKRNGNAGLSDIQHALRRALHEADLDHDALTLRTTLDIQPDLFTADGKVFVPKMRAAVDPEYAKQRYHSDPDDAIETARSFAHKANRSHYSYIADTTEVVHNDVPGVDLWTPDALDPNIALIYERDSYDTITTVGDLIAKAKKKKITGYSGLADLAESMMRKRPKGSRVYGMRALHIKLTPANLKRDSVFLHGSGGVPLLTGEDMVAYVRDNPDDNWNDVQKVKKDKAKALKAAYDAYLDKATENLHWVSPEEIGAWLDKFRADNDVGKMPMDGAVYDSISPAGTFSIDTDAGKVNVKYGYPTALKKWLLKARTVGNTPVNIAFRKLYEAVRGGVGKGAANSAVEGGVGTPLYDLAFAYGMHRITFWLNDFNKVAEDTRARQTKQLMDAFEGQAHGKRLSEGVSSLLSPQGAAMFKLVEDVNALSGRDAFKVDFVNSRDPGVTRGGSYTPATRRTEVIGLDLDGNPAPTRGVVMTLVHEYLHKVTSDLLHFGGHVARLRAQRPFLVSDAAFLRSLTPYARAALELTATFKTIHAHVRSVTSAAMQHDADKLAALYGLKNEHEMLAELQAPEFTNLLDNIMLPDDVMTTVRKGLIEAQAQALYHAAGVKPEDGIDAAFTTDFHDALQNIRPAKRNSALHAIYIGLDAMWKNQAASVEASDKLHSLLISTGASAHGVKALAHDKRKAAELWRKAVSDIKAPNKPKLSKMATDFIKAMRSESGGLGSLSFNEYISTYMYDAPLDGDTFKEAMKPSCNMR